MSLSLLDPNKPPNAEGLWHSIGDVIGYQKINDKVHIFPYNKPYRFHEIYLIKQNGIFVENNLAETTLAKTHLFRPGIWQQKFDNNLNFIGWHLIIADSHNFMSDIVYEPTKVQNNVVMEFKFLFKRIGSPNCSTCLENNYPVIATGIITRTR